MPTFFGGEKVKVNKIEWWQYSQRCYICTSLLNCAVPPKGSYHRCTQPLRWPSKHVHQGEFGFCPPWGHPIQWSVDSYQAHWCQFQGSRHCPGWALPSHTEIEMISWITTTGREEGKGDAPWRDQNKMKIWVGGERHLPLFVPHLKGSLRGELTLMHCSNYYMIWKRESIRGSYSLDIVTHILDVEHAKPSLW